MFVASVVVVVAVTGLSLYGPVLHVDRKCMRHELMILVCFKTYAILSREKSVE